MKIQWNRVTWYSKLLAVVVFLITFAIAFELGMMYEAQQEPNDDTATDAGGVGLGAHCGGFIKDAPQCAAGLHCQLKVNMPDTGGTCVKD